MTLGSLGTIDMPAHGYRVLVRAADSRHLRSSSTIAPRDGASSPQRVRSRSSRPSASDLPSAQGDSLDSTGSRTRHAPAGSDSHRGAEVYTANRLTR